MFKINIGTKDSLLHYKLTFCSVNPFYGLMTF